MSYLCIAFPYWCTKSMTVSVSLLFCSTLFLKIPECAMPANELSLRTAWRGGKVIPILQRDIKAYMFKGSPSICTQSIVHPQTGFSVLQLHVEQSSSCTPGHGSASLELFRAFESGFTHGCNSAYRGVRVFEPCVQEQGCAHLI